MVALAAIPQTMSFISDHAIDKFIERVNPHAHPTLDRETICTALRRMYRASRPATEMQLRMLHVRIDWQATYRLSDTSFGLYILVIKGGCLTTLWSIEKR